MVRLKKRVVNPDLVENIKRSLQPKPTFLAEDNEKLEVLAACPHEFSYEELCKTHFLPRWYLRLVYADGGFDSLPRLFNSIQPLTPLPESVGTM